MSTSRIHSLAVIVISGLIVLAGALSAAAQDSQCVTCHTSEEQLAGITNQLPAKLDLKHPRIGQAKKTARYNKVLVDEAYFDDSNHTELTCDECHGGDPEATEYDVAHKDIVKDPSYPAPGVCADCHDQAETFATSLHATLQGMKTPLLTRAGANNKVQEKIMAGFQANCAQCHSSCGQCHVSRPTVAGGGLAKGHTFAKSPSLEDSCLACHGQTVGLEWKGDGKGRKPDVHLEQAGMYCEECHTAEQIHGDGEEYSSRREVANRPNCLQCHKDIFTDQGENKETHNLHKGRVSCQVCHSQSYNNCAECHLESTGWASQGRSWFGFKIGLNPKPTEDNPDKFVTVRHIPATRDMFKSEGVKEMPEFNLLPTWTPARPHNIRRRTPQNASCNSCHDKWDLFLMIRDVREKDRVANRPVIVAPKMVPAKIEE